MSVGRFVKKKIIIKEVDMNSISRTERRKMETREQIREAAVKMLTNMNSAELKLERVAIEADVSRKTIYNHFSNKEDLLSDIINPILKFCIDSIDEIIEKEEITIKDISTLCLKIYKEYGNQLNLMYNINFTNLEESFNLHKTYTHSFINLFERVSDLDYKRVNSRQSAFVVFKIFVPLLNTLREIDDYEMLFENSLLGLLKGLE
jgi:AcrR family transcriptional regulator